MKYISHTNNSNYNKIERLTKEICNKGSLFEFKTIIKFIISSIINSKCNISCCDTCKYSRIEQAIDGTEKNHIRISFYKKKRPIHIIWDILHEYGHHLSGKPNDKEKSMLREELAWGFGYEQLIKFPLLEKHVNDFTDYKKKCLNTYRK